MCAQRAVRFPPLQKELRRLLAEGAALDSCPALLGDREELIRHTAHRLGILPKSLLARVDFCQTQRLELNSFMVPDVDRGKFEIFINYGILDFHYRMINLFAAHFGLMGAERKIIESPKLPAEKVEQALDQWLVSYWEGALVGTADLSATDLSDSQLAAVMILMKSTEEFVLAHELGHVIFA